MSAGTSTVNVIPPDGGLVRALGLGSATLFVIGSVIGSGIFLTTGVMAEALPSATLLLAAWLTGGIVSLCGALSYAEMGAMYPNSGGVYVYLREAFGPLLAFIYGWAALLVFFSGGIAAVAVGFSYYLSYFLPGLSAARVLWSVATPFGMWTISAAQVVAVTMIAALASINYVGVRSGNRVNVVLYSKDTMDFTTDIITALNKKPVTTTTEKPATSPATTTATTAPATAPKKP